MNNFSDELNFYDIFSLSHRKEFLDELYDFYFRKVSYHHFNKPISQILFVLLS